MCRARPGPRCSNGGAKRIKSARQYHEQVTKSAESEEQRNGQLSDHTKRRLRNADNRLKAAQRVWLSTPKGQLELQDKIDTAEVELSKMSKGTKYSQTRALYNKQKRELEILQRTQRDSVEARKNQYADLHLVKGDVRNADPTQAERRRTRDANRARGGSVNKQGQPSLQREFDESVARDKAAAMAVQPWSEETYDRSATWVEEGTKTGWTSATNARPLPKHGKVIAPSQSRLVRLNTPDGQIVEGRADVHLTERNDGKYVVSQRLTVASSWEDASPIDATRQEVGHIIASKRGVNRTAGDDDKEFATRKEAETFFEKSKRSLNQRFVKDVARTGREGLVGRAHKHHEALQKRDWKVWPRYLEETGSKSETV